MESTDHCKPSLQLDLNAQDLLVIVEMQLSAHARRWYMFSIAEVAA